MDYLGTLTPTKEQWLSVNIPVELKAIVLSFQTATGDPFSEVRSWIRLRRVWNYAAEKLPEQSRVIYPRADKLMLPLGAPASSIFLNSASCDVEIKKYYRFFPYPYTEPDWTVTFHGIG